jgi:hypothetical protein
MTTPSVWRCPVCEGINHGGRLCTTCGEQLPEGYVPQAAGISRADPASAPTPVPAPRPPSPRRFEDVFGSPPPDPTWW